MSHLPFYFSLGRLHKSQPEFEKQITGALKSLIIVSFIYDLHLVNDILQVVKRILFFSVTCLDLHIIK